MTFKDSNRELGPEPILARLKERLGARNDAELADRLGVRPQLLSTWRKRKTIPWAACAKLAIETGIDLHWIIQGRWRTALDPDAAGLAVVRLKPALWLADPEIELELLADGAGEVTNNVLGHLFSIYYEEFADALDELAVIGRSRAFALLVLTEWSESLKADALTDAISLSSKMAEGVEPDDPNARISVRRRLSGDLAELAEDARLTMQRLSRHRAKGGLAGDGADVEARPQHARRKGHPEKP